MQSFLADQDITLTIDVSDVGMALTAVDYMVVDEEGGVIVARTSLPGITSSTTDVTITVPAVSNALPVGKTIVARSVTLLITGTGLAGGLAAKKVSYAITALDRLPAPGASFQSLISADMLASDIPGLPSWAVATDEQKTGALMEARNRMVQMRYYWIPEDYMRRVSSHIELNEYWFNTMSTSEWATMDSQFKTALRRAQLIEADFLLTDDPDAAMRSAGVINNKIGESSKTFVSTRASKSPICPRAMTVIARFLAPHRVTRT